MKRKYLIITTAILFFAGTLNAQQKQKPAINIWNPPVQKNIQNLDVGDVVPDFKISRIFNDNRKSASMSDYKDQLVIFDFGNTGCSGCIAALPHMDKLQKQFGSRIKIFWVTPEYTEDIAKFWNRKNNPYTQNNTLATIAEDSTVRAYFKHKSWPHEAWVYKGKVIAITGPDYVDANNIGKVLSGAAINWPVKNDFYVFDKKQSLFPVNGSQLDVRNTAVRYTALSNYKEGVNAEGFSGGSGIERDSITKTVRAYFLNQPIYNSYLLNLLKLMKPGVLVKPSSFGIAPNEVAWEVADPSKYKHDPKTAYQADWLRQHAICFEAVNPDTGQTDKQIVEKINADLNHLLGLNVRWEKRKEKVLVLVRTGKTEISKSAAASKNAVSLSNLAYQLNQQAGNPYMFNETGYPEQVTIAVKVNSWTDIPVIRKTLAAYGLSLKEEERMVDKLVFTEIKQH